MKGSNNQLLYLGLDTSAYTTSLAIVDQDESLVCDQRLPLKVEPGALGLRQSDAIFAHLTNLPKLWDKRTALIDRKLIKAVAVSARPRPVEGSYMPVFRVCEAFGLFLSQAMSLIFLSSTHQEGHLMAGFWSAGLKQGRYLVVHLSGGTTEIIASEEISPGKFKLQLLGGTEDLNAGQFVDRLGNALGLTFPAGPGLEKLAATGKTESIKLPVAVKGGSISFSGPSSHAERLLQQGWPASDLTRAIEVCITDSVVEAINNIAPVPDQYDGLLAVGGVMANQFIRERVQNKLVNWPVFFARPEFSSDNAVGLAVQAVRTSGTKQCK